MIGTRNALALFLLVAFASLLVEGIRPGRFFNRRYQNGYNFAFRNRDGNERHEIGGFFQDHPNQPLQYRVQGAYQYVDTNNQLFRVNYIADDKGYQPTIVKVTDTPVPPQTTTLAPAPGQPKVVEEVEPADDDDEGGLLDDRIGPNVVKSLLG